MVQSLAKISELVRAEDHSGFLILLDNKTKQVAEGEHEEDGGEAEELGDEAEGLPDRYKVWDE